MSVKSVFYELRPNKLGKLVYGIDLKAAISEECKKQIIKVGWGRMWHLLVSRYCQRRFNALRVAHRT